MMGKKQILVIGGSGFIGTRLVHFLLREGYRVHILDKQMSTAYPRLCHLCDVRDREKLTPLCKGYDVIYNLAAEHKDNVKPVSLYHEVNVEGARNICAAAQRWGILSLIFTSSVAVYGFSKKELTEEHELKPFHPYGKTKMEAEYIYRTWQAQSPERSLVIVRPTVVFGEHNRGNVYNLIKQIVSHSFVMVGNGKNKKSMAYVENVALFLVHALNMEKGYHLYNYIDKPDFDMNALVAFLKKILGNSNHRKLRLPYPIGYLGGVAFDIASTLTGKQFPVSAVRIKKFCANTVYSSHKMRFTGFRPVFSIEEGLEKTVRSEFLKTDDSG
jgi:nucleoside-diphosphate-sugar epimerase